MKHKTVQDMQFDAPLIVMVNQIMKEKKKLRSLQSEIRILKSNQQSEFSQSVALKIQAMEDEEQRIACGIESMTAAYDNARLGDTVPDWGYDDDFNPWEILKDANKDNAETLRDIQEFRERANLMIDPEIDPEIDR